MSYDATKKLQERFGLTDDEIKLVNNKDLAEIEFMAKKGFIRKDRIGPIKNFIENRTATRAFGGGAGMEGPGEEGQLMYDLAPHEEDYEEQKRYDLEQEKNFDPQEDRTTGDPKFMMEIKREEDSIRSLPDWMVEDHMGGDNADLKTEYDRRQMEKQRKADSAYYADLESEPGPESDSPGMPKGERYYMIKDSLKDVGLDEDEIKDWIKSMLDK